MDEATNTTGGSRFLRRVRVGIAWLAMALAFLLVALIVANVFDQALAPETRALATAPPNPLPAERNLYLGLVALDAPPGAASVDYARSRVAAYESGLAAALKMPSGTGVEVYRKDPDALAFKGSITLCKPSAPPVWGVVETHEGEIGKLLRDNRELYRRYLTLSAFSGYYDVATPSIYAPTLSPSSSLRCLFLTDFALRMKRGDAAERHRALADMEGDVRVWRTMLTGEGALISKMIAVANLRADFLALADVIADRSVDLSNGWAEVDRLSAPFDPSEWKVGKAFGYEFRAMMPLWEHLDPGTAQPLVTGGEAAEPEGWRGRWNRFVFHLFYKEHATENASARAMREAMKMAQADPRDALAARDAYSTWAREHLGLGVRQLAYNSIGNILVSVGAPSYDSFPLRAWDAAAVQRLVRLGVEIRRDAVAPADIPEFMRRHPEWSTHPVDGRAFVWDARKGEIRMTPVAATRRGQRSSIVVWQPAFVSR